MIDFNKQLKKYSKDLLGNLNENQRAYTKMMVERCKVAITIKDPDVAVRFFQQGH